MLFTCCLTSSVYTHGTLDSSQPARGRSLVWRHKTWNGEACLYLKRSSSSDGAADGGPLSRSMVEMTSQSGNPESTGAGVNSWVPQSARSSYKSKALLQSTCAWQAQPQDNNIILRITWFQEHSSRSAHHRAVRISHPLNLVAVKKNRSLAHQRRNGMAQLAGYQIKEINKLNK